MAIFTMEKKLWSQDSLKFCAPNGSFLFDIGNIGECLGDVVIRSIRAFGWYKVHKLSGVKCVKEGYWKNPG